jgi:rubrerythrin
MDRTIPVLNDGQLKAYRSTWVCRECGETVLHEWRAP